MKFLGLIPLFFTICLFCLPVFACLTPGSLIGGFDREDYVFIGEVSGYTSAIRPKEKGVSEVIGLEVEVVGKVYLPRKAKTYVVVPLRMMADCSQGGFGIEELRSKFPLGIQIRVIAREPEFVDKGNGGTIRLEAGYTDHTSVSLNHSNSGSLTASLNSIFNYEYLANNSSSHADKYYFVAFEIQKELFRLEEAKSTAEVESILKRLYRAPDFARIDTSEIRRVYIIKQR